MLCASSTSGHNSRLSKSGGDAGEPHGRIGTNLPSRKLSMTCSGILGGVFAFSGALFGGILKDS